MENPFLAGTLTGFNVVQLLRLLQAARVKSAPALLSKRQQALKEMLDRIREDYPLEFSHSEYAVLEPLKHRTGGLSPVVFTFHKAWHTFDRWT